MGKIASKFCSLISHPIKSYERRRTRKIYKQLFTDDIMSTEITYIDKTDF